MKTVYILINEANDVKIAGPQFWMYKGKTLYEISQNK